MSDPRSPSSSSNGIGETVGRYRLVAELGRGAMGVVYRAEDTRLGRPVALKFLAPGLGTDGQARTRLEREAQAASALDHPNICTVYEIGETDDGRLYLALACYDGETLRQRIERGTLPADEAVDVGRQLAAGLGAAHRRGIVHRDVKPSNILITDDGLVKILDFGIARTAESELTRTGSTLGTAAYMSPEQFRGEPDARSDVWALGVILHEMLTGDRPFGGDYEAALLYAVLNEPPAPLPSTVPEALAEIVRQCLEKDPAARYSSGVEVEEALGLLGSGASSDAVETGATVTQSRPPVRPTLAGSRRLAMGVGAIALVVALFLSPLGTAGAEWLGIGSGEVELDHLAVMPFVSSAQEAALGEGLMLTLTNMLGGLGAGSEPRVAVVPSNEMGEIETVEEARERFGVDGVVKGTFEREGDEVRLTLSLVDARTGRRLRTERLSEPVDRLPALQQRSLAILAEMLGLPISGERDALLKAGGTANAEAYEFYLKGKSSLSAGKKDSKNENVDAAIQMFEWALEEDSLFALAHVGLGDAYMEKFRLTHDGEWLDRAEVPLVRALDITDRLLAVRVSLGHLYHLRQDYGAALREAQIALALDSTNVGAHNLSAIAYAFLQRMGEAEASWLRALELGPDEVATRHNLGMTYYMVGRYEEAIAQLTRAVELAPKSVQAYTALGNAYFYSGDYDRAEASYRRAVELDPTWLGYNNIGSVNMEREQYAEAAQAFERALEMNDRHPALWVNLGEAYRKLGGREREAERAYRRAIEVGEAQLSEALSPDPMTLYYVALSLTGLGERGRALETLSRIPISVSSDGPTAVLIANVYEMNGKRDEALRWVSEAFERGMDIKEVGRHEELKDLREDARYQKLTAQYDAAD